MLRSMAVSRPLSSARIRTSASRCRSRFSVSTTRLLTPATPGPTHRTMMPWLRGSSIYSSRTSHSSQRMWTKASGKRLRKVGNKHKPRQAKPQPLNRPDPRSGPPRTRSMTDFRPRLFPSDTDVERVGEGLLSCTLPRDEWTHEAHLAATTYLLLRHPEVDLDTKLPGLIRRYNESVGGVSSENEGYHE